MLHVFEMPNNFVSTYGTIGVAENQRVYSNNVIGNYTVPSDWSVYIVFNKYGNKNGHIKVSSWVEEFD